MTFKGSLVVTLGKLTGKQNRVDIPEEPRAIEVDKTLRNKEGPYRKVRFLNDNGKVCGESFYQTSLFSDQTVSKTKRVIERGHQLIGVSLSVNETYGNIEWINFLTWPQDQQVY